MASSFKFTFFFIVLLFSVGLTLASSAAKLYWETKLPNTPMPNSVIDSLATEDNNDVWLSTHNKGHKWTHSYEVMLKGYEGGGHCHTDAMTNTDILTSAFFLKQHLNPGSKLTVHFRDGPGSANTRFPSPALSHAMPPFKSTHLSTNLHFFNAGPESSDAAMFMNLTLSTCEHPNPINGKNQYCASSLENLVSYVTSTLGESRDVRALSAPTSGAHRDQLVSYQVVGVKEVATTEAKKGGKDGMVACHRLGYPYAVYYCHVPKGTTSYVVSVVDVESKVKTDVNVVCHTQTSEWSSEYVGFKVLGVKPGVHVCHFLQFHDLVWYRS